MAANHKPLVQAELTTTAAIIYTVPADRSAKIRSIIIANITGSGATFDLALLGPTLLAADIADKHYWFKGTTVAPNSTLMLTDLEIDLPEGWSLFADVSANDTFAFHAFGAETVEGT